MYHGDIRLGETIDIKFTTVNTSGAPTTLAGTPVISAYPGNSTTELTAGITLSVDFDSRTGMHNARVVATGGNGYATATNYVLAITTGTVDGTSVVGYVIGSFSIENRSAVMPTTAGRTLDVSAAGEAGLDWANIGSPTTTQGLSGTTVKTATDVETDTADIQARLPAALVSGRIDSSVGAMAANVLTASAINADAITAAKIADGAIDALTFAAGAINAAAIATDAIDGDAIAASAVSEIQSGLATSAALATVQSDTDDIQSRLPAALVSGRIDASVGAMATDVLTGAAINADAVNKINQAASGTADAGGSTTTIIDAERTEADTDYWKGSVVLITSGAAIGQVRRISAFDAGTDTITVSPAFTQSIATGVTYIILRNAIAEVLVDAIKAGAIDAGAIATNAIDADALAADAVTEIQSGLATSAALATVQADTDDIQTRLPAALVSGRIDASVGAMAANVLTATAINADAITAAKIAPDAIGASELAADAVAEIADAVWDELLSGHLGAGSTGEALDAAGGGASPGAIADAVWDEARAGHVGAGSFGEGVVVDSIKTDAVDANAIKADAVTEIQSGLATAAALATVQSDTDDIQARLPATLDGGLMRSQVKGMDANTMTAAAAAADLTTELQTGLATAAALATVQADTDDIQGRLPASLSGGKMRSQVEGMDAGTVTAAAVATDAIDGDAIAASAVTEIQSGLATAASLATVQSDTDDIQAKIGAPVSTLAGDIFGVQADTDNIQGRLPAALVGGRIDASVGAMAADVLTASALAASAVSEIQTGLALDATVAKEVTLTDAEAAIIAAIAALNNLSTAQVLTQVNAGLDAAGVELSAIPGAAPSIRITTQLLFQALRNELTTTATQKKIKKDDGTVIGTAPLSDDLTTMIKGKFV